MTISASRRSLARRSSARLHRAFGLADTQPHGLNLHPRRRQLDALVVGGERPLAELGDHFLEPRLLVGQRALRLVQRARLQLELLLAVAQLIAQRLVARFQRKDRRGLLAKLLLELIDGVALLGELGELRRRLRLHLIDAHFEPPGRHGEFGAQLILVGADFGDRQRRRRLEAPHRQAHGAVMYERDEEQSKQCRNEEADPEIHDRFDHDTTPPGPSLRSPASGGGRGGERHHFATWAPHARRPQRGNLNREWALR